MAVDTNPTPRDLVERYLVLKSTLIFFFCVWLPKHNFMSTGERMLTFRANPWCVFCNNPLESRQDLFFNCPYTSTIWNSLTKKLLRTRYSSQWSELLFYSRIHGCRNNNLFSLDMFSKYQSMGYGENEMLASMEKIQLSHIASLNS